MGTRKKAAMTPFLALRGQCTTLGHAWEHAPNRLYDGNGSVGFYSICDHCFTERKKWVTRSGVIQKPVYTYPEGYKQSGEDKLSMQEIRQGYVIVLMEEMK